MSKSTLDFLLFGDYDYLELGLMSVKKSRNRFGQLTVEIVVSRDYEHVVKEAVESVSEEPTNASKEDLNYE